MVRASERSFLMAVNPGLERAAEALRLHRSGASYAKIGQLLGAADDPTRAISAPRAGHLVKKGERLERYGIPPEFLPLGWRIVFGLGAAGIRDLASLVGADPGLIMERSGSSGGNGLSYHSIGRINSFLIERGFQPLASPSRMRGVANYYAEWGRLLPEVAELFEIAKRDADQRGERRRDQVTMEFILGLCIGVIVGLALIEAGTSLLHRLERRQAHDSRKQGIEGGPK
jgi:hypothetical protein